MVGKGVSIVCDVANDELDTHLKHSYRLQGKY